MASPHGQRAMRDLSRTSLGALNGALPQDRSAVG